MTAMLEYYCPTTLQRHEIASWKYCMFLLLPANREKYRYSQSLTRKSMVHIALPNGRLGAEPSSEPLTRHVIGELFAT